MISNKLLTVEQVAMELQISKRKVWRMISTGDLRTVRIGDRGTRVPLDTLNEYVAGLVLKSTKGESDDSR